MSERDERSRPVPDLSSTWAHGPYATPTGPATWVPPLVQHKRRSRRPLLVAAAAVVAVLLVVGGVLLTRGDPLTLDGRTVADPEAVVADADEAFAAYAADRNGATGDDSRCWFELTDTDGQAVRDVLLCGPVRFVDGAAEQSWLRFPVTAEADGDDVRLPVAAEPADPEPGTRPDADLLRRPDGGSPPDGAGGVDAPAPPQAEPGWSAAGPFDDVSWTAPEGPSRLSGPAAAATITGLAQPDRVGSGDDARRAADGERLIAVQYALSPGEGRSGTSPAVSYQVSGADPIPVDPALVAPGGTLEAVLSVPEDTEAADLVLDDAGVQQRLSLLTGAPAAGNLQVLARTNRGAELNAAQVLTATVGGPGRVPAPLDFTVALARARLQWFGGVDGSKRPADPTRAWLVLDASMAAPASPPGALPAEYIALTLPDGTVLRPVDLDDDPAVVQPAFDVPAGFTAATINVTGIATFADGAVADFGAARMDVPISIPAG